MKNKKGNVSVIVAVIGFIVVGIIGYFMIRGSANTTKTSVTSIENNTSMMQSSYVGKIIAGNTTPYIDFNESDYEKAKREGKIIILNFYANWCPICRGEAPIIEGGFNGLQNENIVGFRVNYNDSETDTVEKELASEQGVTYQHTKVILKDGKQVLKDGTVWDSETFKETVNSVL